MNAPSVDIKDMLEAYGDSSGLDVDFTDNLHIGKEPDKPDNCVTIFDTGGGPPQLTLDAQYYEYPSVQIRVRNRDYRNGFNLIQAIMTSLHGRGNEIWNDALYTVIYCSSGPALLDWDENSRCRFIVNFNLQRRAV